MMKKINLLKAMKYRHKMQFSALRLVGESVFNGMVTYAAPVWYERALLVMNQRPLVAAQRAVLLTITSAYRTTSNEALPVLAGVLPIMLRLDLHHRNYKSKKGETNTTTMENKRAVTKELERRYQRLRNQKILA